MYQGTPRSPSGVTFCRLASPPRAMICGTNVTARGLSVVRDRVRPTCMNEPRVLDDGADFVAVFLVIAVNDAQHHAGAPQAFGVVVGLVNLKREIGERFHVGSDTGMGVANLATS